MHYGIYSINQGMSLTVITRALLRKNLHSMSTKLAAGFSMKCLFCFFVDALVPLLSLRERERVGGHWSDRRDRRGGGSTGKYHVRYDGSRAVSNEGDHHLPHCVRKRRQIIHTSRRRPEMICWQMQIVHF